MTTCIECGAAIEPGHKGFVNKCDDCLFRRKPTMEQRRKWDDEGNFYVDSSGQRVYYDVVRSGTVRVPIA